MVELFDIVKKWLEENGYDGLCLPDEECGCVLEDFMPCGEPNPKCEAGHCVENKIEGNIFWLVFPGKKEE